MLYCSEDELLGAVVESCDHVIFSVTGVLGLGYSLVLYSVIRTFTPGIWLSLSGDPLYVSSRPLKAYVRAVVAYEQSISITVIRPV